MARLALALMVAFLVLTPSASALVPSLFAPGYREQMGCQVVSVQDGNFGCRRAGTLVDANYLLVETGAAAATRVDVYNADRNLWQPAHVHRCAMPVCEIAIEPALTIANAEIRFWAENGRAFVPISYSLGHREA